MSIKDETTSLEHPSGGQSLVVHRGAAGGLEAEWGVAPPATPAASHNATAYLHAVRRHWLLGTVVGVICAAVLAVGTWFLLPRYYTASALISVAIQPDDFFKPTAPRRLPQDYEIYKATQIQNVLSPGVLTAALRDRKVNTLGIVRREEPDPITWLQEELRVRYPGDGELMQVSLTDYDPEEVALVVRAIVDAYDKEIVQAELRRKRERLAELEKLYAEKEAEARTKWTVLQRLTEEHKTNDSKTISVQTQAAMQLLGDLRRESVRLQSELRKAKADLTVAEATLKQVNEGPVNDFELAELERKDPMCLEYQKAMAGLDQAASLTSQAAAPGANKLTYVSRFQDQVAGIKSRYDTRLNELRELVKAGKRTELEQTINGLKVQVAVLDEDGKSLDKEVGEKAKELEDLSKFSVDVELLRAELDSIEAARRLIAEERESLRVELRAQPPIQVRQQAEEPRSYDGPHLIIAGTIIMGVLGLVLPLCGIIWWDVRKQRINTSDDVAHRLGVPVIGSVPVIPSRAIRRLGAPSKVSQQWNVRLTESIDAIAAKLLRNATLEGSRVVLITSAVSGEGKTTLATQIAMSLARAGRRTVLVDFDLRRPAIDKAFQLPLQPGVSEGLCGETEVSDLPQATDTKNLSVVTAGRCDRHALQALANGADQRIFETLRTEFEFVIVDGSPILPVADSRYVAQHVDAVVLSVFRDYSRAPKVMAACEILEAFGVRDVEAVVASASEDGYGMVDHSPAGQAMA